MAVPEPFLSSRMPQFRVENSVVVHIPEGDIRQRAYERWMARGRPLGDDQRDWFEAQAELLAQMIELIESARERMRERRESQNAGKIFIGHGRSNAWRDLKDLIQEQLHLDWDEFNREPTAGLPTTKRLEVMLDNACFAFLVMTAEDEHLDGTAHARENVIHEAGLFQGRLGFRRAIILLEEGCPEFSNIVGLAQIRFPRGRILAVSEEIRRVLEREGVTARGCEQEATPSEGLGSGRPRRREGPDSP